MRKCFYDMNLFKEKDVEALNSEMIHFKENSKDYLGELLPIEIKPDYLKGFIE
jgi:hypothetical protein